MRPEKNYAASIEFPSDPSIADTDANSSAHFHHHSQALVLKSPRQDVDPHRGRIAQATPADTLYPDSTTIRNAQPIPQSLDCTLLQIPYSPHSKPSPIPPPPTP